METETVMMPKVLTAENGAGEYSLSVIISWTTIKEIYVKAVKELGV